MTEIIDFKSRKRSTLSPDEGVGHSLEEFVADIFKPEKLEGIEGLAVVFYDKDGYVDFHHVNLNWMQLLWCARQMESYCLEEDSDGEYEFVE